MVFIDFTKAFDTVNRELLWKLLDHFGCPNAFTKIIRDFHEGMQATALVDGDLTEPFLYAMVLTLETRLICILLLARRDVHFDKRMICFLSDIL